MFAISATALLATIGLLYSVGFVLAERRSLQTAADAASLRGAWQVLTELQSDDRLDTNVRTMVLRYAASNGVPNASDVTAVYVDGSGAAMGTSVGCGCAFPATARGVRVTVNGQTATLLPGFLGTAQVLVQASATATGRPTATPTTATLVVPVAVSIADYAAHGTIDLFGARARALDLRAWGATEYGPPMSNDLQYWSDGQHNNGTLSSGSDVTVVTAANDSIAAGLADNIRRQKVTDASGTAYAIVSVPLYNGTPGTTAHLVGFARVKIKASDVSSSSARGTFVPYPFDAFGTVSNATPDYGASLVGIVS